MASAETERVIREGFREHYLGEVGHGPLILRHYRVEFPHGLTRDTWRYRIAGQEITLALLIQGTMPDGTPAVQETKIVSAVRAGFDAETFSGTIPPGARVQNLWERVGTAAPRSRTGR